jgi:hypothetical protein
MKYVLAVVSLVLAAHFGCAGEGGPALNPKPVRPARTVAANLGATDLAQVREDDLRSAFPEIAPENQVRRACLWDESGPGRAEAFLSPSLVDEHVVETCRVECSKHFNRPVACELFRAPAYFVSDPKKHFTIGEGLDIDEAMTVVRLFEEGALTTEQVIAASDVERPGRRVFEIRKTSDGYRLQVWRADCGGCDGFLHVKPVIKRGAMVGLHARSDLPMAGCVIPPPAWLAGGADEATP